MEKTRRRQAGITKYHVDVRGQREREASLASADSDEDEGDIDQSDGKTGQ